MQDIGNPMEFSSITDPSTTRPSIPDRESTEEKTAPGNVYNMLRKLICASKTKFAARRHWSACTVSEQVGFVWPKHNLVLAWLYDCTLTR